MALHGINPRDWQDSVPSRNDEKESFHSPFDSSLQGCPNSLSRGSVSRSAMNDPFTFNLTDTAHISRTMMGISGPPRRCSLFMSQAVDSNLHSICQSPLSNISTGSRDYMWASLGPLCDYCNYLTDSLGAYLCCEILQVWR